MSDDAITTRLGELRLIPVVAIEDADHAKPLAEALREGGLPCAEITFRTDAAEEAISRAAKVEGMLVGAGTVLNLEQAQRAVDAGAQFLVAPGLDAGVVIWCRTNDIPVFPGVATPTDLTVAVDLGLDVVKLFPAEALGGLPYLKALVGPFPRMRFIPTGGIHAENACDWLAHPRVHAIGGSWMAAKSLIAAEDFAEITRRAREATTLGA